MAARWQPGSRTLSCIRLTYFVLQLYNTKHIYINSVFLGVTVDGLQSWSAAVPLSARPTQSVAARPSRRRAC